MSDPQLPSLAVVVTDVAGKRVGQAKVSVTPVSGTRNPILLNPENDGTFRSKLPAGGYLIRVEAPGLAPDQRYVELISGAGTERFILGREGLPAYYLGNVRVPFEPTGLVAASLKAAIPKSESSPLDDAERELKLEPVEVRSDTEGMYRLYRTPEQTRKEAIRRLKANPRVRFAGTVVQHSPAGMSFLTDEMTVRFKPQVTRDAVDDVARKLDLEVVRTIPYAGNAYLFHTSDGDLNLLKKCEELVRSGRVEYAEPSLVTTKVLDVVPNDTLLAQQEHHAIIGTEAAWDITMGDHDLIIGVVDDGCDETHPDFQVPPAEGWTKIVNPYDFLDMDADPTTGTSSHGTKSCGIAAATADNALGVAGVAPGCRLLPARWPNGLTDLDFADMYVWMAGFDPHSARPGFPVPLPQGASVISNSFGSYEVAISGIMRDAFDFITTYGREGKGCVVVFSAGNDNVDFTNSGGLGRRWAEYAKTIAVAASRVSPPDPAETKVSTSNFGPALDLCAPSGGPMGGAEDRPLSTSNVGAGTTASPPAASLDYSTHGQTSSACPQVAGAAALVLSADPELTWVEVRQILRDTAVKIDFANANPVGHYVDTDGDGVNDFSQWYGYGRIDVAAAVATADTYPHSRDVHVRENLGDTGMVASTGAFWSSPDIWVRNTDPAIEGAVALPAGYLSAPPDEPAKFGHDNWVYVRFRNRGADDSLNFSVRIYLAHWAGPEFVYPTDFVPSVPPSGPLPVPLVPGTYLIGEAACAPLASGTDSYVTVRWPSALVPPETVMVGGSPVSWHPCLLAEITPHDGPTPTGNHVWDDNNLAQRNITIDYVDEADESFATAFVIGNRMNRAELLDLVIDRGNLPRQVQLYIDFVSPKLKELLHRIVVSRSLPPPSRRNEKISEMLRTEIARFERYLDLRHLQTGNVKGREAVLLIARRARRVRVPVPRDAGELVPIVIGGQITGRVPKGAYTISVRQYDENGRASGAAALELRFR